MYVGNDERVIALRFFVYGLFVMSMYLTLPQILMYITGNTPTIDSSQMLACVSCDVSSSMFTGAVVQARAAYVYDIKEQRVLYAKNAETQLPLASITKGMTALLAQRYIPSDVLIHITEDDLTLDGDNGLFIGETFSRDDLIDLTLSVSSNDGAHALARVAGTYMENEEGVSSRVIFIKMMNTTAHELGLAQTFFMNETGLDESVSAAGAYGSAHDVTLLYTHIYATNARMFEATLYPVSSVSSLSRVHVLHNTDELAGSISGLAASKTGFTDLAGGNLVVVFEPEPLHPIVAVVLGSTTEGRFSDIATLVDVTLQSYAPLLLQ